jgi:hypothetical protein
VVYQEGDHCKVRAGKAHGVTSNCQFELFQHKGRNSPSLGIFSVDPVDVSSSTLLGIDSTQVSLPAYAVHIQTFPIFVTEKLTLDSVRNNLKEMNATDSQYLKYLFVDKKKALLGIDVEDNHVIFDNFNDGLQKLGFCRMPFRVRTREDRIVHNVIQAAINFNRLLNLTPENGQLRKFIKMEFIRVERPKNQPFGRAVPVEKGKDLCNDGKVEVISSGSSLYGIKISNESGVWLYPHLFLLDCSDLSVGRYYFILNQHIRKPHYVIRILL